MNTVTFLGVAIEYH